MARNCEPMNKNWLRGDVRQGEWSGTHEALGSRSLTAYSQRRCSDGVRSYLGRARLMAERPTVESRSEQSAEAVVAGDREGPNEMESH